MKKLFFLFFAFASCGLFHQEQLPQIKEAEVQLTGTNWILISLEKTSTELIAEKPISLNLNADNTFKGFAGCNQYWGICKLMSSEIHFSNINRTKMSCDKIDVEQNLLETLRNTKAYFINGSKLQLLNNNAEIIATFQAIVKEIK